MAGMASGCEDDEMTNGGGDDGDVVEGGSAGGLDYQSGGKKQICAKCMGRN